MKHDHRPFADTLILPLRDELREDSRYDHWLKLADIALAAAREEQSRIKEQIRPHVERYKKLRGQSSERTSKSESMRRTKPPEAAAQGS
jgi:hypothetical protein